MSTERVRPYEGPEPYIFVSYSHRDLDRITPILRGLTEKGYRIWYDEGIDPGTEWPESIANHLENSRVCVPFISPFSADSRNCRREINFALSRNIDLLTVFLEETKLSSGLEMQISTFQSIMGYKYPDLPSLIERIESMDGISACRGTKDVSAADREAERHGDQETQTSSRQKKRLLPAFVLALILIAAAAALWLSGTSRPAEGEASVPETPGTAAAEASGTEETAAVTAETTASPVPGTLQKEEQSGSSVTPEPAGTAEPIPEGYRLLISGEWEDGSLFVWGDDGNTVRISLTDNRISDGYHMSDEPGEYRPDWSLAVVLKEYNFLWFTIYGRDYMTSFSSLHTEKSFDSGGKISDMGSFRYRLNGNTFTIESALPEGYTTEDVTWARVQLGTQYDSFYTYTFHLNKG